LSAHLCAIGTAVPSHKVTQAEVAERTRRVFGLRMPEFERLAPVFDNAGIATRCSVRPSEWYEEDHDWSDRTAVYHEAATALFLDAARIALEGADLTGAEIDTVVTVSSTGIATPSLEARAAAALGLRPNVSRVPVFGLGCAGGVTGLSIAARLAESRPGSNVLLVAVELCSLAIRLDKLTKANIVALALFADGAAAAVVRSSHSGLLRIDAGAEHTWPDTLDIMGWSIDPQGFGVIFDRTIPPFAEAHLAGAVDGALMRADLGRRDIDRFICHPGGARVVEAIETALELAPGQLDHERAVLAEFGNMSAPTALFVLERVLRAGHPGRSLLMALGPGFTLSTLVLSRAGT
jgi:alkylresorcinol/alkylpyrone synthase